MIASRERFGGGLALRSRDRDELRLHLGEERREHLAVLGVDRLGDDDLSEPSRDRQRHQHSLGRGRTAVVEAGVGNVHAGQLRDQRLILERRLERALTGFGLVGRVGRIELARGRPGCPPPPG